MLKVIKTVADPARGTAVVTVASDHAGGDDFTQAFHELESIEARKLGINAAAADGVVGQVDSVVGPYPVTADGVGCEQVLDGDGRPLPLTDPRTRVHAYHCDVHVARRQLL